MPNAALQPSERNKLLTLHHELLYPAFLGAALVEFAERIAKEGIDCDSLPWLISALWFLLYFSVAFLGLAEADEDTKRDTFGKTAFWANLFEIGIILGVSVFIERIDSATKEHYLRYWLIYGSWMAIPVTGGVSNYYSARPVRMALSAAAFLVGLVGLCVEAASAKGYITWTAGYYWIALIVMYLLLLLYFETIFGKPPSFLERWDKTRGVKWPRAKQA
jgi:hypothetical protein